MLQRGHLKSLDEDRTIKDKNFEFANNFSKNGS